MIWVLLYVSLILAGFGCVFYLSRKLRTHQLLWRLSRRKPSGNKPLIFGGGSPDGSPSS